MKVVKQPLKVQKPQNTTSRIGNVKRQPVHKTDKQDITTTTRTFGVTTTTTPKKFATVQDGFQQELSGQRNKLTLAVSTKNAVQTYMRHFGAGKKPRVAEKNGQPKLSLTKKVETALQLTQFAPTTQSKNKSLNKITHLERNLQNKLDWLEKRLSVPIEFLSLQQIQDIYHLFLDIRFVCDLQTWNKVVKMWSQVSSSPQVKDMRVKQQAQTIAMSLLDELVQIQNLGTFTVMKQKQYGLPEHLIKFNLRPTEETYSHAMKTLNSTGNYSAALKIFDQYNKVLDNIPQTQYMPSPVIPYGPEREQEFVQRRMLAQRRQELLHTATNDGYAMQAAVKSKNFELADTFAKQMLTERGFEPSAKFHKLYSESLVLRNQHFSNITLFKQLFQAGEENQFIKSDGSMDKAAVASIAKQKEFRDKKIKSLLQKGLIQRVEREVALTDEELAKKQQQNDNLLPDDDVNNNNNDSTTSKTKKIVEYQLVSTGQILDLSLSSISADPTMTHVSYNPSRESWHNVFRSILALHPPEGYTTLEPTPTNNNKQKTTTEQGGDDITPNTTEHGLTVVHNDPQKKRNAQKLQMFISTQSGSLFDLSPEIRQHVYRVAKEEYGLALDSSYFTPMLQSAKRHEVVVQYMNDFHQEVEALRQKAKENPWTEDELAQQEKERKIKSMLVVDLNVDDHDVRMGQIFGRYKDQAKKLGYNEKTYAMLSEKLLLNLIDAYVADEDIVEDINADIDSDDGIIATDGISGDGTLFSKLKKKKNNNEEEDDNESEDSTDPLKKKKKLQDGDNNNDDTNNKLIDDDDTLAILNKQINKHEQNNIDDNDDDIQKKKLKQQQQDNNNSLTVHKKKNGELQLFETPVVSTITKMSKETMDTMLSATSRKKVKNILSSLTTLRAFQNAYGLPVNAKTESNYLEALILMTRRNEVYPPCLATTDNSLIKPHIAAYTPTHTENTTMKWQLQHQKNKPLLNFKDRINYVHASLTRREQQMKLTLKEIEQSIDSLSTMKYELDEETLRLKQHLNLKVLNDAIESLCELSVDASILRGPFDGEHVFHYEPRKAQEALNAIALGQHYPGVQVDPRDGTKYVPGVTEPRNDQVDHLDLNKFFNDGERIKDYSFVMMKELLSKLLSLADGMPHRQIQDIPLLQPDEFNHIVTAKTYLPLLKATAAHGDYTNTLLLLESAHQHRGVTPTTDLLNYVAIAFINSTKQRNAAGVLDIMFTASQQNTTYKKQIKEQDVQDAIVHGGVDELLQKVEDLNHQNKHKILPNMTTVALLLHMYKEQGMLDHVEELWRRLTYREDSSWTAFSAVEEQQLITEVLANELDASATQSPQHQAMYEGIRTGKFKSQDPELSLKVNDMYEQALNPKKNPALKDMLKHDDIRTNMLTLLRGRDVQSVLPRGAHRDDEIDNDYKFKNLRLDSATITAMVQTFIQLGHPMHAIQLYLDQRQRLPVFPIITPAPSKAYKRAIELNQALHNDDGLMLKELNLQPDPVNFVLQQMKQKTLNNNNKRYGDDSDDEFYDDDEEGNKKKRDTNNNNDDDDALPITQTKIKPKLNHTLDDINTKESSLVTIHTGNNEFEQFGTRIKKQIRYNMAAFTPKMIAAGNAKATKTTQTLNIPSNALINIQNNQELLHNPLDGDEQTAYETLIKTQWPEIDTLASVAIYALRKGQKFIDLYEKDNNAMKKDIYTHAKVLVDTSTSVLGKLQRYAIDHPYLPGDESTIIYFSQPQTHNNCIPQDAGLSLTQPRLILPLLTDTEHIYQEFDTLCYTDVTLEETVFKLRHEQTVPLGMKRWFTIFPTMVNQCKAIYSQYDERLEINDKLNILREQVNDLVSVGKKNPQEQLLKNARVHRESTIVNDDEEIVQRVDENGNEIIVRKQIDSNTGEIVELQVNDDILKENMKLHTLQAHSSTLHNPKITSIDRGMAHPVTTAFVKDIDAKKILKDEVDLPQEHVKWLGTFKNFLFKSSNTKDIMNKIKVPSVADDNNNVDKAAEDKADGDNKKADTTTKTTKLDPLQALLQQQASSNKALSQEEKMKLKEKLQQQMKQKINPQEAKKRKQDNDIVDLSAAPPKDLDENDDDELNNNQEQDDSTMPLVNVSEKKKQQKYYEEQEKLKTLLASQKSLQKNKDSSLPLPPHMLDKIEYETRLKETTKTAQMVMTMEEKASFMSTLQTDVNQQLGTLPKQRDNTGILGVSNNNKLVLPEIQQNKQHITNQSHAQHKILNEYEQQRKTKLQSYDLTEQSDKSLARYKRNNFEYNNVLTEQIAQQQEADQSLIFSSTRNAPANQDHMVLTGTEWLTPTTDLHHAKDIARRNVETAMRRNPTPGVIDDARVKPTTNSQIIKQIQQPVPDAQPIKQVRAGGVNTSPFGPESYLPPEQFRAPSTAAKLINQENPDVEKMAISTPQQPFTLHTHGVGYSDRPGIPTKISQEYLEKYVMGVGSDPKDKRNQKRHQELEKHMEGIVLDTSFIKPREGAKRTTNTEDRHQEGYGGGLHKFRARSYDKQQKETGDFREKFLNEFTDEVQLQEKAEAQMSKKEKETMGYQDLFEKGDGFARTGRYDLLTKEDKERRDEQIKQENFKDLESQLDQLFKAKGNAENMAKGGFTATSDDINFNKHQKKQQEAQDKAAKEARRVKELFATALNAPTDKFGLKNQKTAGRSTLLD